MTKPKTSKMRIERFDTEEAWIEGRLGKITGTKAGNLILKSGKGKKIGFYELLAERVAIPARGENAMDRGKRLEDLAIERFEQETGKKVDNDLMIWYRADDDNIAVSPDGMIGNTEAVECKCLSSARHCEAFLTKKIPSDYEEQVLQYFIVNDELEVVYFVFYDPRMPKDFFFFKVTREEKEEEIKELMELERNILLELSVAEDLLTF